jgi:hypothetical protein
VASEPFLGGQFNRVKVVSSCTLAIFEKAKETMFEALYTSGIMHHENGLA